MILFEQEIGRRMIKIFSNKFKSTIRKLHPQDFNILDAFLTPLSDTSMFMRSNVRQAGFTLDHEKEFSADYYGCFEAGQLYGILAFCWNGMILSQVPEIDRLSQFIEFVRPQFSQFPLKGILGPSNQVLYILNVLMNEGIISENQIKMSSLETTYGLLLNDLIIPPALTNGEVCCRLIREEDIPILIPWSIAYHQEAFHVTMDEAKVHQEILSFIEHQTAFVLEVEEKIVARADFNAILPDIVQMGGVWTPPDLRSHGYARAVVAGALLEAKHRGIERSTLFTHNPSAMRAYESLGFKPKGTYHILLFV
jgi:RimJ/RimL family protein N-acetyltransferase